MVLGSEEQFSAPDFVVNGAHCTGQPVCSLVIAPFEIASWHIGVVSPASINLSGGSRRRKGSSSRPGLVIEPLVSRSPANLRGIITTL